MEKFAELKIIITVKLTTNNFLRSLQKSNLKKDRKHITVETYLSIPSKAENYRSLLETEDDGCYTFYYLLRDILFVIVKWKEKKKLADWHTHEDFYYWKDAFLWEMLKSIQHNMHACVQRQYMQSPKNYFSIIMHISLPYNTQIGNMYIFPQQPYSQKLCVYFTVCWWQPTDKEPCHHENVKREDPTLKFHILFPFHQNQQKKSLKNSLSP